MTTFSNDTSWTGKENLDYLDKFTTNENEIMDCREWCDSLLVESRYPART